VTGVNGYIYIKSGRMVKFGFVHVCACVYEDLEPGTHTKRL